MSKNLKSLLWDRCLANSLRLANLLVAARKLQGDWDQPVFAGFGPIIVPGVPQSWSDLWIFFCCTLLFGIKQMGEGNKLMTGESFVDIILTFNEFN